MISFIELGIKELVTFVLFFKGVHGSIQVGFVLNSNSTLSLWVVKKETHNRLGRNVDSDG